MKIRIAALLFVCPLALAAPLSAAPAPAPARSAMPIELHIDAQAPVEADGVEVVLAITAYGSTAAEAEANLTANREAVVAKLGSFGIDTGKLIFTRNAENEQMVSSAALAAMDAGMEAEAPKKKKKKQSADEAAAEAAVAASLEGASFFREEDVTIRLADRKQADALLDWTAERGEEIILMSAKPTTSDPEKARRAAREKALTKARQDADEYAALMGYHVVRVVRVNNARPAINWPDTLDFIMMMEKAGRNRDRDMTMMQPVETVSIDFLIAPN